MKRSSFHYETSHGGHNDSGKAWKVIGKMAILALAILAIQIFFKNLTPGFMQ